MAQPSQSRLREFIGWLRGLLHKAKPKPMVKTNYQPKPTPGATTPKPTPKPKPVTLPPRPKAPAIKQITMYDSTEVKTVPPGPEAVAGYVGGKWPTFKALVKRFPQAHHLSIAIDDEEQADCLDIENGDANPSQAPAWVKRQKARGVRRPVVYASLSAMPAVLRALNAAHIGRQEVRVWTAHYTYKAHICTIKCGFGFTGTADATQWTDRALGRNLDESLCQPGFFS